MAAEIPLREPDKFFKGDTVKWRKNFTDYLPDSWTLYYEFVNASDHQEVTGTDNGDGTHLITLNPSDSNKFYAGTYRYVGYVDDGTDRYTLTRGSFEVIAEFDQRISGYDGRSHSRKALECIEKIIENRLAGNEDMVSMSVGGRSTTLMRFDELVTLRSQYLEFVRQEEDAERVERGLGTGRKVLTRFVRPDWLGPDGRWRWPFNN